MEVAMHESLRKSELPIPEITFALTSSVLAYQLLKPTFKKVGDKIAEKITLRNLSISGRMDDADFSPARINVLIICFIFIF